MIKFSFKLSLGIFVSFSLNGISSHASLSSIPNPSVNEDDFEITSFLPERTIHPSCQMLLNTANAFYDFCQDDYEKFKKSYCKKKSFRVEDYEELKEKSNDIRNLEFPYIQNVIATKNILMLIGAIDQRKIDSKIALEKLLTTRLRLLDERAVSLLETQQYYLKYKSLPKEYFISTKLTDVSMLSSVDQELARRAIDRYQFLNLMIYHLYKIHDPYSLPENIKQLISCSRTLWPILNDETSDLSYPDHATATYDEDPSDLKNHKDYNYYWSNFKEDIILMNWCKQPTTIYLSQPSLRRDKGAIPLPKPIWLYPAPVLKETFPVKVSVSIAPKKSLDQPKKKTNQNVKRPTKSNIKMREENVLNSDIEVVLQKEEQNDNRLLSLEIAQEITEISSIKLSEKMVQPDLLIEKASGSITKDEETAKLKNENSRDKEQLLTPQDESQNDNNISVRPRGMRVFHSEMIPQISETETILKRINNNASHLIEIIFNPKMKGQGFTFGQFKTLWERLNGDSTVRSSGNGSSHFALLNSNLKVVGGTFAHGEGQKYTRNTVRYLRDALNMIGIFPQN